MGRVLGGLGRSALRRSRLPGLAWASGTARGACTPDARRGRVLWDFSFLSGSQTHGYAPPPTLRPHEANAPRLHAGKQREQGARAWGGLGTDYLEWGRPSPPFSRQTSTSSDGLGPLPTATRRGRDSWDAEGTLPGITRTNSSPSRGARGPLGWTASGIPAAARPLQCERQILQNVVPLVSMGHVDGTCLELCRGGKLCRCGA